MSTGIRFTVAEYDRMSYDRGEKLEIYASARIKDYWIVNLPHRCIEVYRKPRGGEYHESTTYQVGESVSPLAFPAVTLDVSYVFSG